MFEKLTLAVRDLLCG